MPTYVDNDAKALALGEGWIGAAAGRRDFIAIVVSTGVGGGLVLDGRLLEGRLGNAGHVGHVVVVPEGRACVCGGRGCLEAEASGTALAAITGRPAEMASTEMVGAHRDVGRPRRGVGGQSSRPAPGGGQRFGGPGLRRTVLPAAQCEVDLRCGLDFARGARVVPGGLGDRGPLVGAARVGWRGLDTRR